MSGDWVVAEISGTRQFRRMLRAAMRPEDLIFDADDGLWRIRGTAWGAACAVFWSFQMSVEMFQAPDHGGDGHATAARTLPDDAIRRARRLSAAIARDRLDFPIER
ncbi:MAG: hypothetical protein WC273_00780 [Dehalococcoidia bacterium]